VAATYTLSGNPKTLLGGEDFERIRAYVTCDQDMLTDPDSGEVRVVGEADLILATATDTTFSVELPGNGWTPSPHFYTLHIEGRSRTSGANRVVTSQPFQMTADITLADLPQAAPKAITVTDYESLIEARDEAVAARDEAAAITAPLTAPANAQVASYISTDGATKTAIATTIGASPDVQSARSMAIRGFAPKTQPVALMLFGGQAGHGFTSASFGSPAPTFNLNDTTDFALGDRSIKITTGGGGPSTAGYVSKTGMSYDATGRFLRIWLKMGDIRKVRQIQVMLGNDAFTSYFSFLVRNYQGSLSSTTEEKTSTVKSGEWTVVDVPWSVASTTGSPTRSALTSARVLAYDNTGVTEVGIGGLALVDERPSYANGVVSLCFDDTHAVADTIARPIMDAHGYAGTLYPIVDLFGASGRLTLARAKELMRVNGWDFGYHATSQSVHDAGLVGLSEPQVAAEFEAMRAWAAANGVVSDSFAWPLGYTDPTTVRVASRYFRTGRSVSAPYPDTLPPQTPMQVRSQSVASSISLATAQAFIDKVKAGKCWGVLTFHTIVASSPTGNDTTTTIFQGIIDYLAAQGVPVQTVGQVMDRL